MKIKYVLAGLVLLGLPLMAETANSIQPPHLVNTQQRYFLETCSLRSPDYKVIFKIDTYTGRTWNLSLDQEKPGFAWKEIVDIKED